jgi:type IV pilus assembly protein PilP
VKRVIVTGALALLLWGCGPETTGTTVSDYEAQRAAAGRSTKARAKAEKPGQPGVVPPEAQASAGFGGQEHGYTYVALGKRDPFRSFVLEHAKDKDKPDRGPLEQFDLAQLSLVAVVWDTPKPRALVTDPSGRGYIVAEGTAIGKNEGRIIKISDNSVVVKETYEDYLGGRTEKDIELHVRQNQGG